MIYWSKFNWQERLSFGNRIISNYDDFVAFVSLVRSETVLLASEQYQALISLCYRIALIQDALTIGNYSLKRFHWDIWSTYFIYKGHNIDWIKYEDTESLYKRIISLYKIQATHGINKVSEVLFDEFSRRVKVEDAAASLHIPANDIQLFLKLYGKS